ncbi:MAG: GNAT family N-acetyltransferase [Candidatus Ozemobacteraceae bacterium]
MISIKRATSADINVAIELRIALLTELAAYTSGLSILQISDDYFLKAIKTKLLQGVDDCFLNGIKAKQLDVWLLEFDSAIVSTGGLITTPGSPTSENAHTHEGYIFNMYTQPSHRKIGCARAMLQEIISFSKSISLARLWLKASRDGFPLYQSVGFKVTGSHAAGHIPMELYL